VGEQYVSEVGKDVGKDVGKEGRACGLDYSIVIPVFNNEGSLATVLEDLLEKFVSVHPEKSGEIIFVDDGSTDGSFELLTGLQAQHPGLLRIVKLTRNFGQPFARLAGLRSARGECVISMAADGQEPAALVKDLFHYHVDEGYQVVIAARKSRDESWFRTFTSKVFYGLMRRLSFPTMPIGGFSFVLLGRSALSEILRCHEAHPFFQGQILWTGFAAKIIEFHRPARISGFSGWTLERRITLLVDAVVGYSYIPIRLMAASGIVAALLGLAYATYIVGRRLSLGALVPGWATVTVLVLVIGGFQLVMLGILGEYLWRTLAQSLRRPEYVIEREISGKSEQ